MDFPKLTSRLRILSIVMAGCALLGAIGCTKSDASRKLAPADAKQERLAWNLQTTVVAYDKVGEVNSAWDEPAKRALTEFARARSGVSDPGESWDYITKTNVDAAVAAGCQDPLVQYLHVKSSLVYRLKGKELADKYCDAALALKDSGYPDIRKFYASLRAVQQVYSAYGQSADRNTLNDVGGDLNGMLLRVLDDKTMPAGEMYDACSEGLNVYANDAGQFQGLYEQVEKKIFQNWPGEAVTWLVKGQGYISLAWNARGSGTIDTVTEDGWKSFTNRLATAEEALNRAWELDPKDVRIPLEFLGLELGQGQGRERLELWFQRAMQLDPASYDACWKKLYYLEPKWYGSAEDLLAFGRECVNNPEWKGHVPLILVDAHVALARYVNKDERDGYWKRPEVWPDIKAAYDKFFELNPNEVGYYHNYVWYAYHCEQWDALNELLPKLGTINYDYFGGADEFAQMVKQAKEHAKK